MARSLGHDGQCWGQWGQRSHPLFWVFPGHLCLSASAQNLQTFCLPAGWSQVTEGSGGWGRCLQHLPFYPAGEMMLSPSVKAWVVTPCLSDLWVEEDPPQRTLHPMLVPMAS